MKKPLIHWLGLTGVAALLSYAAAVIFAPLAYPDYNRMAQAVSDLSAEAAPSRQLWSQLAALAMMMIGSIGTGVVPPQYFGIAERFSVFAAVGFNAVLGMYLFHGFKGM